MVADWMGAGRTAGGQTAACSTEGGSMAAVLTAVCRQTVDGPILDLAALDATADHRQGTGDPVSGLGDRQAHPAAARSAVPAAAQPDRGRVVRRRRLVASSLSSRHSIGSCRRSCGS
jgi:hypothetical protein